MFFRRMFAIFEGRLFVFSLIFPMQGSSQKKLITKSKEIKVKERLPMIANLKETKGVGRGERKRRKEPRQRKIRKDREPEIDRKSVS